MAEREAPHDEAEKPSLSERIGQFIENDRKKWFGMSLGAHARLGLAELREAFSPDGNIVQQTPYGMWGTLTPGEVADAREPDRQSLRGENDNRAYDPREHESHEQERSQGR